MEEDKTAGCPDRENLRLAMASQRLIECLDAKARVQGVRQSPSQHMPTRPIHDRHQVKEASAHRDIPTTGLNTSLTDPNGQWTATAKAKIIEKNDSYWEFSYFVDMINRTDEEREYIVKIHFVDADGFSIEEDRYAGDALKKIPAKSTKRLLDRAFINTENAPTVVGILLEVNVR